MKKIDITEVDLARVTMLLTALKRGKWELEGEEILAFSQVFQWSSDMRVKIKASLDAIEPPAEKEQPKKRGKSEGV